MGDAYRVDVQDPDGSGYTSTYMFEADGARYTMDCSADDRDAHDWMDLAETLELQPPDGAPDDDASPDETAVAPADDESR